MATVPRAWIDGYADSLEMTSDEMRRRLVEALEQVDYTMPVAYVRERLVAIMQAHVYESRAMASQLAAEFYDGLRERQVGERMGAVAYDGYDPVRVERRVRSAVQPLAKAQEEFRWADDVAHDEEYQREMTRVAARKLCRDLADYQGYSIKEAAGSTVFRNGGRDGRRVRFARIPRGSKHYPNGCPFCQMLASRGFVYRSELTAGDLDPDHYHSDCQCMVVPSWGKGSVEGYDPHDYDEGYQAYLDQDHSEHEARVAETQRNRYDAWGRLKSGDGNRVDEKGALTDEDRARIRSKRTAAGNETRKADRSRLFRGLGVTEAEWKAMSEAEQAALLETKGIRTISSRSVGGEMTAEQKRNAARMRDEIARVRPLGPAEGKGARDYLRFNGCTQEMVGVVEEALDYIPTDWLEDFGRLGVRVSGVVDPLGRSHYVTGKRAVQMDYRADFLQVVHELVHAREHSNPEFLAAEKRFYDYRVRGHELRPLSELDRLSTYVNGEAAYDVLGESIFAYLYAYYEDRRGYEIGSFGIESFYRYQETFQRSDRRAFLVARELILRM